MTRIWTPACTQGPVLWVVLCFWTESASVLPAGMRCYSYHHSLVISSRKQAWEEPRSSEVIPSIPCIPSRSWAENRFMQPCKFPSKSSDRQNKPGINIWNPSCSHQTNNLDYCGRKKRFNSLPSPDRLHKGAMLFSSASAYPHPYLLSQKTAQLWRHVWIGSRALR